MKCPVCQKDCDLSSYNTKENFYYDCEHCYSSLFFKDGDCQVLSEAVMSKPPEFDSEPSTDESLDLDSETPSEESSQVSPEDHFVEEEQEEEDDHEVSGIIPEVPEEILKEEELEANLEQEETPDFEFSEDFDGDTDGSSKEQPLEEEKEMEPEEAQEEESLQEGENFSEVEEYGNKQSLDKGSVFSYDLILSEINSEEVGEKIKSLLEDESFQIDEEKNDLVIKDGILEILDISPVKVHVIVKSLMGLSLKISWKQHLMIDKK